MDCVMDRRADKITTTRRDEIQPMGFDYANKKDKNCEKDINR